MLYAAVNNKAAWPLGAEEIEYLEKRLRRLNFNYQVGLEMRMFNTAEFAPLYRYVLLKWENLASGNATNRTVLLETHDIEQMASALKMLVSIEETEVKQRS
jgi:hypothetical protein